MKKEDLQQVIEAISKSGIHVAGDLVLEKHVEHEVANVEAGGIGIQIINGEKTSATTPEKKELSAEKLAKAIENCQDYFWGSASYAVVFCVCRDDYKMTPNMSAFERKVELLSYKKERNYVCKTGTITNAFSDNNIYHSHIDKWKEEGADERQIKLRDELRNEFSKD